MVVVSHNKDQALGKKTVDKLIFAMAKPKVSVLTAYSIHLTGPPSFRLNETPGSQYSSFTLFYWLEVKFYLEYVNQNGHWKSPN